MDVTGTFYLFLIMVILAALPSSSVALVVVRAATHGVPNGVAVALGIVCGDLIFVALALLGMSVIAETMGVMFSVLRYVGGAYLIWLGYSLIRTRSTLADAAYSGLRADSSAGSLVTSFFAGLTLTLGDLKAILFYASLFPNLVDMTALSGADTVLITAVTILAVGGVKSIYAFAARKVVERYANLTSSSYASPVAGSVLIGTGAVILTKS